MSSPPIGNKLDMGTADVFGTDGVAASAERSLRVRLNDLFQRTSVRIVTAVILTAVLMAIPFAAPSQYVIHVIVICLIWIPLSIGQNLVTGNAGITAMGQAAFYAVGAYTAAILATKTDLPAPLIMLIAVASSGIVGVVISFPAVRVSGDYVFVVTLGLNLIVLDVATQWTKLTGGARGIPGIPLFSISHWAARGETGFYWVALVVAAVCVALAVAITTSRYGRTLGAIREDPMAAAASGIRKTAPRVAIVSVSAMMGGAAGSLFAYYLGFVGPTSFTTQVSLLIFEMAIIGGLGNVRGSILGTVLLIALPELLRPLQDFRLGIGGIAILILMVYRPNGILGSATVTPLVKK
jgi:ABC-type branched-subunit amino acid transport system permease subunit